MKTLSGHRLWDNQPGMRRGSLLWLLLTRMVYICKPRAYTQRRWCWATDASYLYLRRAFFLRIETIMSYSTSLKAKRHAAVMALWVTLGPIPK